MPLGRIQINKNEIKLRRVWTPPVRHPVWLYNQCDQAGRSFALYMLGAVYDQTSVWSEHCYETCFVWSV